MSDTAAASRFVCASCDSVYRVARERCPRCNGPAPVETAWPPEPVDVAGEGVGEEEAPPVGVPAAASRPPINAPKADHIAYACERYGRDPAWWDATYTKSELTTAGGILDQLDAMGPEAAADWVSSRPDVDPA